MLSPEDEQTIQRILAKNDSVQAGSPATGQNGLSAEENLKVQAILAQTGAPEYGPEPTPLQALQFRQQFSWGALFYNVVYYYSVKDWQFFWASLICTITVYPTPVIIILAFYARRRAWQYKAWDSVAQFEAVQKRWDRNGWIGLIATVILFGILAHFLFSALGNAFGTNDPSKILQQVQGLTNGTGN